MKLRTLAIVWTMALGGCVSTKNIPLQDQAAVDLQGRSVAVVTRERPDFAAMTAEKAMFAAIGAVAMISAGNQIIEDNDVADPADYISRSLASSLAETHGMQPVDAGGEPAHSEKVADIAGQYSSADILVDVRTVNWSFGYFPTDWDNYRVIYSAKLRLIDTGQGKVLAEGFCSRTPEKSDNAPTHDELLADNAARLKSELKSAADYCIAEFSNNALNL